MTHTLSDREQQVYDLLLEGLSNKEIGLRLDLSEHTVKTHVRQIMRVNGEHSRCKLIVRVFQQRLAEVARV